MSRYRFYLLAVAVAVPGLALQFSGVSFSAPLDALLFGIAILGAAFLLSWGAEAAQRDIAQGAALAALALIAILPEYVVDAYFTWQAGTYNAVCSVLPAAEAALRDQCGYVDYAAANMTGANRLLVGFAWPLMVVIFWLRSGRQLVRLNRDNAAEVAFLSLATIYSLTIPLKGSISLIDMLILSSFFAGYLWRLSKMPVEDHHIIGPAAKLADLPKVQRRLGVLAIVVVAAIVILSVAKPFAEALVATGADVGIDSFLLVQWLAPLASEAAEFIVCVIFALKLMPTAALGTLISSKINQWTLLVAMLPLVFSLGASFQQGSTQLLSLPLGDRQNAEFFLTAAQSLFATAVLLTLSLNLRNAMMLFSLFATQVAFGFIMRDDPFGTTLTLNIFAWIYLSLAVSIIVISLPAVRELVRVGLFNRESLLLDRLREDELTSLHPDPIHLHAQPAGVVGGLPGSGGEA